MLRPCLFTLLCALSLLACLALCLFWARSYRNNWHGDRLFISRGGSAAPCASKGEASI